MLHVAMGHLEQLLVKVFTYAWIAIILSSAASYYLMAAQYSINVDKFRIEDELLRKRYAMLCTDRREAAEWDHDATCATLSAKLRGPSPELRARMKVASSMYLCSEKDQCERVMTNMLTFVGSSMRSIVFAGAMLLVVAGLLIYWWGSAARTRTLNASALPMCYIDHTTAAKSKAH